MIDVENDGEYYWNRRDNSTCWRLPRGVKHRWCLFPSGLYRDVALQVDYRVLPLSDHVQMLCILAGMDQKDTYAVGFGGHDASRAVFLSCQGCSSSSSSTEWWTFLFYEYGFGRPSVEREVQWGVRVHSSICGAHRDVVHSPFGRLFHRCHCICRDHVLFVGRLP